MLDPSLALILSLSFPESVLFFDFRFILFFVLSLFLIKVEKFT